MRRNGPPMALASKVPAAPRGVSRYARAKRTPAPRITKLASTATTTTNRRELPGAAFTGGFLEERRATSGPPSALRRRARGARLLDGNGHLACSGLFESQCQRKALAFAQRAVEADQHDMLA